MNDICMIGYHFITQKYNCSFIFLLCTLIDICTKMTHQMSILQHMVERVLWHIGYGVQHSGLYGYSQYTYIKLERYYREQDQSNLRALTPPIYLLLVVLSSAELSMKSMTRLGELMVVNRAYHQSRICGKDHCNVHLSHSASDATPHCVLKCVLWGHFQGIKIEQTS